jgi:hypothetical protein
VDDKALVLIPRGDDMRHSSKTRELGPHSRGAARPLIGAFIYFSRRPHT